MKTQSFHIITLGCQMNYTDSARIKAILLNCGFSYSEKEENADIIIFDTCSVRQKAEDKITGKMQDIPTDKKIRITGCMIQHVMKGEKKGNFLGTLQNIDDIPLNESFNPLFHNLKKTYPNLELFFRIDDVGFLPLILQKIGYKNLNFDSEMINEYEKIIPHENPSMNQHSSSAYVPLSAGCNQFCAYCIVPFARGLERNFSVEQVVKEARFHLQNGAKEITLLGQIVNKHPNFVQIVQEILKLDGLEWLRYTSPYPTFYSPELLVLHETEPKLCPHIHIPFQSGSSSILKKMFRGYSADEAYLFIDKIRGLKCDISITTDMIIGFPGETDEDFAESIKLVKYGRFDMIYMGIYSTRPGTFAAKQYPDDIPYSVKHARRKQMNELLKQISLSNNQSEIGKEKKMLINEITPDGKIIGYTDNMKQIIAECSTPNDLGSIIPVLITGASEFKLQGEIII
ncbi:tRNA-2-methylthio-N(6)-dimethylallyladenosine synthase [candidate division SR1 bacterium]|nr:tRNA-2-methylthio-N(6)-dimethylallyladenosine synthase [candidate division SR1 bacterium]